MNKYIAYCALFISFRKLQMCHLSKENAEEFYETHKEQQFFPKLTSFMASDCVVAMELVGLQAIQRWRDLMGPTDSTVAQTKSPNSLRACFGTDGNYSSGSCKLSTKSGINPLNLIQNAPTMQALQMLAMDLTRWSQLLKSQIFSFREGTSSPVQVENHPHLD